jgi:hypothetical protein
MTKGRRFLGRAGALALIVLAAGCGGDDDTSGPEAEPGAVSDAPVPAEMCDSGESPAVAAYSLEDGGFRWAVCSSEAVRHDVLAATDETVYLEVFRAGGRGTVVAYDVADGSELPSADPPPKPLAEPTETSEGRSMIEVDGIQIVGGQDDPTTALDSDGEELWTHPGSPPYDNVWAVGDDGVYVIDRQGQGGARLVAYELESGQTRWELGPVDPYGAEVGWPWYVRGTVLFTIWSNLALLSTEDGSTLWRTDYPVVQFPRMTGVSANDDTVFVAFSSLGSGGD